MNADDAHLILKIETNNPVELKEFVGTFVGLGNQFEHYYDNEYPQERGNALFYVREVRAGSIIIELVPYLVAASPILGVTMAGVKYANDLAKFVETFGGKIRKYFKRGGRDEGACKGDLSDYLRTVQAVLTTRLGRFHLRFMKTVRSEWLLNLTHARLKKQSTTR